MDFDRAMNELALCLETGDPADALARAREIKAALLSGPLTDPVQLGWARDYELRALHRLGRWAEGLAAFDAPEPRPFVIGPKNAAWLCSVAAEMAYRSGAPERVPGLTARAMALRVADRDARGALLAANTGFTLCSMARRPDCALELARRVEQLWRAERPGSPAAVAAFELLGHVADARWGFGSFGEPAERARDLALHDAARAGDAAQVRRLLAAGARVDAVHPKRPGMPTALIAAAFAGHAGAVSALVEAGAEVDFANVQGRTSLHLAADQGHADVVEALLGALPDLNRRDFNGQTALHLAAWQDHAEAVAALLKAGIDAEIADDSGLTALALAATEPVPRVIGALCAAGVNVDAVSPGGQTPLMLAAMQGHAAVALVLLEAGASRARRDAHGLRAAEWAQREGHAALAGRLARA